MPGDALTAEELDPHAALLEVQQRLPAVMLVENILWTSVLMLCLAPLEPKRPKRTVTHYFEMKTTAVSPNALTSRVKLLHFQNSLHVHVFISPE